MGAGDCPPPPRCGICWKIFNTDKEVEEHYNEFNLHLMRLIERKIKDKEKEIDKLKQIGEELQ